MAIFLGGGGRSPEAKCPMFLEFGGNRGGCGANRRVTPAARRYRAIPPTPMRALRAAATPRRLGVGIPPCARSPTLGTAYTIHSTATHAPLRFPEVIVDVFKTDWQTLWKVFFSFTDHFSGPDSAIGSLCVFVCLCSNFRIQWPLS